MLQWPGPCTVVEALSNSTYRVQEDSTKKIFTRSVALMARFHGVAPSAAALPMAPAFGPAKSNVANAKTSIIAVVDEPSERTVWLMSAEQPVDDTASNPATATFKLVLDQDQDGKVHPGCFGSKRARLSISPGRRRVRHRPQLDLSQERLAYRGFCKGSWMGRTQRPGISLGQLGG